MAKEVSNANVSYFKIDSDGYIYLSSKVELEGYKPHLDDEGKVTGYRKIFSATDEGPIVGLGIRIADFPTGKVSQVYISIKGNDGIESISFPLLNSKGGLSNYATALAIVLPNVDFSKEYSISFDKRKDEKGYVRKNIFFNYGNNEFVKSFHKFKNKEDNNGGDIPPMVQVTALDGRVTWDTSDRDMYLMNSLKKQFERFEKHKGVGLEVSKDIEVKSEKTSFTDSYEDDDDLDIPF